MKLVDTHCHLVSERLKDDLGAIVSRANDAGVEKIINIAYDPETVELVCEQIKMHRSLYAAIGIQPHDAKKYTENEAEKIRQLSRSTPKVVAIGEIGLDYHYTLSPKDIQIQCFENFLQIALDEKLPVVVHVRDSHSDVYSRLQVASQKGLTGVIHCFTGSLEEAKQFLDSGFYISFSGIVTFKNAVDLKEVAKYVPKEKILIETDSPYLAPIPQRGKTNEPAWVRHVCEYVAALRKEEVSSFALQTFQNAETLFSRMK